MEEPEKLEIASRDQAEAAGAQIVALNILRSAALEKQNRASFAAQKHGRKVSEISERIGRYTAALEEWSRKNRKEFGEAKTLKLRHVDLEFKMAPRSVQFLEGWTVAKCILKLKSMGKAFKAYIRTKEELDRQEILKNSKPEVSKLDAKTMRRFGIMVCQDENFSVTPRLEDAK